MEQGEAYVPTFEPGGKVVGLPLLRVGGRTFWGNDRLEQFSEALSRPI